MYRFFNSQHNQLASASAEGRVIVWRLSVQQGAEGDEVVAEQLLSLLFQDVAGELRDSCDRGELLC